MKNIKSEPEDTLRPEYERADLGELVRGKYATTQVGFHQLTEALLTCIGEDEGMRFTHYSIGNDRAKQEAGDWTYEIDNSNQVTLRYWLSEFGSIEEPISNPPVVTTPDDREKLQAALLQGVETLLTRVAQLGADNLY